jgi:hypothetical protein
MLSCAVAQSYQPFHLGKGKRKRCGIWTSSANPNASHRVTQAIHRTFGSLVTAALGELSTTAVRKLQIYKPAKTSAVFKACGPKAHDEPYGGEVREVCPQASASKFRIRFGGRRPRRRVQATVWICYDRKPQICMQ